MRIWLTIGALAIALVSCGRSSPDASIVVQNEAAAVAATDVALPAPVVGMVDQLGEIARSGSHRDMARLASPTPGFRSNDAGMDHRSYWYLKLRTGDWPMAHLAQVLAYPPGVEVRGDVRVYVWPYMALKRPSEMTPKVRRDIESLLGPEAAQRAVVGAPWPGYRLGVAEDGTWLYFYTGAD